MGLFDKLFHKNSREKSVEQDSCVNIERNDGSILRIRPILDNEGKQTYKVIQDEHGKVIANIPHYLVYEQQEQGKIVGHHIYMDVDKEYLNIPYYADYIANTLLSEKRLHSKILNSYHGYAGAFDLNENGQITGRSIRAEVVEALNVEKINEHNDKIRYNEAREQALKDEIRGKTVHIKEDHAERLSPDMMPEWMREGHSRSGRNSGLDR